MSKKHFEAIAEAIKTQIDRTEAFTDDNERYIATEAVRHTAGSVAEALSAANPRFDTRRFLAACGIN